MLSLFLAKLLGLQLIVLSIALFTQPERFRTAIVDFHRSEALVLIGGAMPLLLGLAIVLSHNIWTGWPILITLLGYLMILKGVSRLFFPEPGRKLSEQLVSPSYYRPLSLVLALFGIVLAYLGFTATV